MKKIIYSIMAVTAITMASCGAEAEDTKKEGEAGKTDEAKQEEVKVAAVSGAYTAMEGATITWKAKHNKDEDWAHVGTMNVTGSVEVAENTITSGEFTFDVASLNEGDGEYQEMLENHLQDSTFFNTAVFPNATFVIGNVTDGKVTGSLELLGMTQEIMFDAEITVAEESVTILGAAVIDLLAFNMPSIVEGNNLPEDKIGESPSSAVAVEMNFTLTK
ncbi:MAG: polyisoprenoid-binding protein YceI [Flavobacteriales bacterium]|jgi:polyisoprenoid-binding protein YceI